MPIEEIKVRKQLFDRRVNGLLADEILEAIAAAETGGEVVLTLDQAIAVGQMAATIRLAITIGNSIGEMLEEQSLR